MAATAQSPAAAALQAGLDAVERGDFLDAYGFFSTALASTADPAQQAQVRRGAGWARRAAGVREAAAACTKQRPWSSSRVGVPPAPALLT